MKNQKTISEKEIKQFRELYEEKFGERISKKKASEKARKLIQLYKKLSKIKIKTNYEKPNQ